ncbi:MAG: hypothetical protein IK130_06855 [Oscillospiraceae bacterium]|nr:hypothetical protein [Oscillospiraceae bacterium]
MQKKTVVIMLDYLKGPIWDSFDDFLYTGIPVIDSDAVLRKLNVQIGDMFSSYYEFNSHEQGCWFDAERQKAEKQELLALLTQLTDRLYALNDGSYEIDDRATAEIRAL